MGKGRRREPVVYLLCLERRMSHAKHYAGTSVDVDRRLAEHRSGRGSKFTQAVVRAGIEMRLAATWPGRHPEEKYFKLLKNSARHCPFCREDFLARDRARRKAKRLSRSENTRRTPRTDQSPRNTDRPPNNAATLEEAPVPYPS